MINDHLNDSIKAAFCAHHHIKGDHQAGICPLPEGYCHVIGQLALSARRLEQKLEQEKRKGYVVTGGAGGAGGSSAGAAGNAGAGGSAYFGGRSKRIVVRYKNAVTGQIEKYGMQVDLNTCDDEIQIDLRRVTGGSDED